MSEADGTRAFTQGLHRLKHATGIVIPVYLPDDENRAQSADLIRDTVVGCCEQVSDPAAICLSIDGRGNGDNVARDLAAEYGVDVALAPLNRGKLQGVREGVLRLLEHPHLHYIAVLDDDSDHFANELLNFVRAAEHISEQTGDDRVMVLGRRISRHRPMGLLRGELEDLADRILLHALAYHAAISGQPLRLEYATLLEDVPDFHSGYKLFSRHTARDTFTSEPETIGLGENATYRHAVEAVMTVEALLSGARLGVVNRSTYNRQPTSKFGLLDRAELTADMIAWPCKRLGVPGGFIRQWMDNDTGALLLATLSPQGRAELEAVYRAVLAAFDMAVDPGTGADPFARQPLFL